MTSNTSRKSPSRRHSLLRDRRGAVLATTAVAMPVMMGFAAIGVEVGLWYADRRDLQTAADAAALSGAFERVRGNPAGLQDAARREARRNGFNIGAPANQIAVNNPPLAGSMAGEGNAVEVVLVRQHEVLFASLFLSAPVGVAARSVASVEVTGEACVLALDRTASAAVYNQGSTVVNMAGCVLAANSNALDSIKISGSATVDAYSLWTVGQVDSSGGSLSLTRPPTENAWELDDPWASLTVQPYGSCQYNDTKFTGEVATISPGVYCGGLDIGGTSVITMQPGTYVINRGDLKIGAQATVRCSCPNPEDGVTFVLTSSGAASDIGDIDIRGGADIQLRAPSGAADPYRGVLIYQDRRASTAGVNKLNGGASMSLSGGIYIPQQAVEFSGNNAATACTQIVARTVTFIGNSTINNAGCQAAGVQPVTVTAARLKE